MMAIGDKAAAKGLAVYPSTQLHSLGYQNDNQRGDDIADEIDARTAADTAEASARTSAIGAEATARAAADALKVDQGGTFTGTVAAGGNAVNGGNFGFIGSGTINGNLSVLGNIFVPNRTAATSGYIGAYINGDGRLAVSPSSRRFKQNIKKWSPDKQAILALDLYQFRYKLAVKEFGKDAQIEHGVMAEDLLAVGLDWLVVNDADGIPFAVRYELIALALIPVIQDHEARLTKAGL